MSGVSGADAERRVQEPERVLVASQYAEDHSSVRRYLRAPLYQIHSVSDCRSAGTALRREPFSVLICEAALPDGTWQDLQFPIDSWPECPALIVISRLANERLWAEVLNRCGSDVLAKPLVENELRYAVEFAVRRRGPHRCRPVRVRAGVGSA